ncbi:MAG: DUF1858 domain-containing protein [Archangium sp.]|nr:DUF1858 domain-containing protein [Archangium sp.]
MGEQALVITGKTRVSDIVERYGDLSGVMEVLGLKLVGSVSLRRQLTKFLTVERAAGVQGVPLDRFLVLIQVAIAQRVRKPGSQS